MHDGMVKIREHNWETGNLEPREYPIALFEPFLDWLFTTKAWIEDPSRVNRKVLELSRRMADYRNPPATHFEAIEPGMEPTLPVSPKEALAAKRRASLVRARAAKQAKRELQHA